MEATLRKCLNGLLIFVARLSMGGWRQACLGIQSLGGVSAARPRLPLHARAASEWKTSVHDGLQSLCTMKKKAYKKKKSEM